MNCPHTVARMIDGHYSTHRQKETWSGDQFSWNFGPWDQSLHQTNFRHSTTRVMVTEFSVLLYKYMFSWQIQINTPLNTPTCQTKLQQSEDPQHYIVIAVSRMKNTSESAWPRACFLLLINNLRLLGSQVVKVLDYRPRGPRFHPAPL